MVLYLLLLSLQLPVEKTAVPDKPFANMTRDSMRFMTEIFVNPEIGEVKLNPTSMEVEEAAVVNSALMQFKKIALFDSYLDVFRGLRNLLTHRDYYSAVQFRHPDFQIPPTTEKLEVLTGFKSFEKRVVEISQVKNKTRVLYRGWKSRPRFSIAQTLETQEGDLMADVRETELILERPDNSGWDFIAYDLTGKLSKTSTFYSKGGKEVVAAVPYTCMTCHYDGMSRTFQYAPLSYHP